MSRALTVLGNRRFLFWIRYDGSFFLEMARGITGRGVLQTFHLFLADYLKCETKAIKLAPTSRTDKTVHAVRNPLLVQLPPEFHWIDESEANKASVMRHINSLCAQLTNNALNLLDFHGIAPTFSPRDHVSYRKYVYRICVPKHRDVVQRMAEHSATIASFSEHNYAWIVPPSFDAHVAAKLCVELEGKQRNYASFFRHPSTMRRDGVDYRITERTILYMRVEQGEPYSLPNDEFDYFNIVIVSRGFLREQVRRLLAVIVAIATGKRPFRFLEEVLAKHEPNFLPQCGLRAAPGNGLFLADVVYDPMMFEQPTTEATHAWDLTEQQFADMLELRLVSERC